MFCARAKFRLATCLTALTLFFQGITPDPDNLSSGSLFRILSTIAASHRPTRIFPPMQPLSNGMNEPIPVRSNPDFRSESGDVCTVERSDLEISNAKWELPKRLVDPAFNVSSRTSSVVGLHRNWWNLSPTLISSRPDLLETLCRFLC